MDLPPPEEKPSKHLGLGHVCNVLHRVLDRFMYFGVGGRSGKWVMFGIGDFGGQNIFCCF